MIRRMVLYSSEFCQPKNDEINAMIKRGVAIKIAARNFPRLCQPPLFLPNLTQAKVNRAMINDEADTIR